jgi:hypothetical protein
VVEIAALASSFCRLSELPWPSCLKAGDVCDRVAQKRSTNQLWVFPESGEPEGSPFIKRERTSAQTQADQVGYIRAGAWQLLMVAATPGEPFGQEIRVSPQYQKTQNGELKQDGRRQLLPNNGGNRAQGGMRQNDQQSQQNQDSPRNAASRRHAVSSIKWVILIVNEIPELRLVLRAAAGRRSPQRIRRNTEETENNPSADVSVWHSEFRFPIFDCA